MAAPGGAVPLRSRPAAPERWRREKMSSTGIRA